LKVIIIKYFKWYFKYFKCSGFCLKISGKIGLGGSSKTRNFWIKVGKFSLSSKCLKILHTSGNIRTNSGILGLGVILSYI
jgi:ribosomal protein S3